MLTFTCAAPARPKPQLLNLSGRRDARLPVIQQLSDLWTQRLEKAGLAENQAMEVCHDLEGSPIRGRSFRRSPQVYGWMAISWMHTWIWSVDEQTWKRAKAGCQSLWYTIHTSSPLWRDPLAQKAVSHQDRRPASKVEICCPEAPPTKSLCSLMEDTRPADDAPRLWLLISCWSRRWQIS